MKGSALFIVCAVFCFLSVQCFVYCVSSVVFIVCRVLCFCVYSVAFCVYSVL